MKSRRYTRRRHSRLNCSGSSSSLPEKNPRLASTACWRSCRTASLPSTSMASRMAYFRSSLTPKACLWAFSSRLSSRLAPLPGASESRCSKAAAACRVSGSLRSRISFQSKRRARLLGHLKRSSSSHSWRPTRMMKRGAWSAPNSASDTMDAKSPRSGRTAPALQRSAPPTTADRGCRPPPAPDYRPAPPAPAALCQHRRSPATPALACQPAVPGAGG